MTVHPTGPIPYAESYAWPGGYPIVYLVDDGDVLGAECVNDPSNPVHFGGDNDGWQVVGSDIHWEGEPLVCAHCGRAIESAYGIPDEN